MSSLRNHGFRMSHFEPEGAASVRMLFFVVAAFIFYPLNMTAPSVFFQAYPPDHGTASWYSKSDPGINEFTASGEVFDDVKATCASRDFPFGTYIKVTNVRNGESVICRVNDRGPNRSLDRVIDLTKSSFQKISDPDLGLIEVTVIPLPQVNALREDRAANGRRPSGPLALMI